MYVCSPCMQTYMYVCMHMYARMYVHVGIYVCMHVCMYMYVGLCMYLFMSATHVNACGIKHALPLPYFLNLKGWRGCLVVNVLDCQLGGSGFKFRPGQIFSSRFLLHLPPPAKSAMRSTLTVHCQWEDETM